MHFDTSLQKFDNNVWGYYLPVPAQIARQVIQGNDRRVKYILNDIIQLHGALMPKGESYFLLMNEANVQKLSLDIGNSVTVEIEKDSSAYGMPMPESFETLLDQDETGNAYFHALTPGKQRNLIYIVGKVKSVDKQINKGLAILHHLKDVGGKLDFKMLNEMIKHYNQQSKLKP